MRKQQTSAAAQRAFEWYARLAHSIGRTVTLEIRIHAGSGNCVCSECERAKAVIDQVARAGNGRHSNA